MFVSVLCQRECYTAHTDTVVVHVTDTGRSLRAYSNESIYQNTIPFPPASFCSVESQHSHQVFTYVHVGGCDGTLMDVKVSRSEETINEPGWSLYNGFCASEFIPALMFINWINEFNSTISGFAADYCEWSFPASRLYTKHVFISRWITHNKDSL